MTQYKTITRITLVAFIVSQLLPVQSFANTAPAPQPGASAVPTVSASGSPAPQPSATPLPQQPAMSESPLAPAEPPPLTFDFTPLDQQAANAMTSMKTYLANGGMRGTEEALQSKLDEINATLPPNGDVRLILTEVTKALVGDLDNNGAVDGLDITPFVNYVNMPNPPTDPGALANYLRADFNKDGHVNYGDIGGLVGALMGPAQYQVVDVKYRVEYKMSSMAWGQGSVDFFAQTYDRKTCIHGVCQNVFYEARAIPYGDGVVRETFQSYKPNSLYMFWPLSALRTDADPYSKQEHISFKADSYAKYSTVRFEQSFSIITWHDYKPEGLTVIESWREMAGTSSTSDATGRYYGRKDIVYDLAGNKVSEMLERFDSKGNKINIYTNYVNGQEIKRVEFTRIIGSTIDAYIKYVAENVGVLDVTYDTVASFPFIASINATNVEGVVINGSYDLATKQFNMTAVQPPPVMHPKVHFYDPLYTAEDSAQFVIGFDPSVSASRINAILAELGLIKNGDLVPGVNTQGVRVSDPANLKAAMNAVAAYPEVTYVVHEAYAYKYDLLGLQSGKLLVYPYFSVPASQVRSTLLALGAYVASRRFNPIGYYIQIQPGLTTDQQQAVIDAIRATGLFSSVTIA